MAFIPSQTTANHSIFRKLHGAYMYYSMISLESTVCKILRQSKANTTTLFYIKTFGSLNLHQPPSSAYWVLYFFIFLFFQILQCPQNNILKNLGSSTRRLSVVEKSVSVCATVLLSQAHDHTESILVTFKAREQRVNTAGRSRTIPEVFTSTRTS